MKLRVLVADDEALARKEIRRLLQSYPEVEVVAEAKDGDDAAEFIKKFRPDLVFLDIRMPGMDGFSVLDALDLPLPEVVFCTAYDQFAVDAVRRGALDYLLKPIAPEDLARALRRAGEKIQARMAGGERPGEVLGMQDRVFLRDGKKAMFVEVGAIRRLTSEGNYTRIQTPEDAILMRRTLDYFEARLDPAVFFRANRAEIINLLQVRQCLPAEGGRLRVKMEGGDEVEISRRRARAFQEQCRV